MNDRKSQIRKLFFSITQEFCVGDRVGMKTNQLHGTITGFSGEYASISYDAVGAIHNGTVLVDHLVLL